MLRLAKNINTAALKGILLYQKTISPDHGPLSRLHPYGYCRYSPTCSDYAYLAVKRYGTLHGLYKAAIRIIKCNPFSKGGIDPLR